MRLFKIYIVAIVLLCFTDLANAQTNGCYISATSRIYYQGPVSSNTYFTGSAYYVPQAQCSGGGQYYTTVNTTNTNCYAVYDGNGSQTNSSNYSLSGKKRTFNLLTCPIDTYTMLLMALMGGVGFFFLRRMNYATVV